MKKSIIFILLIIFSLISTFDVPDELKDICPNKCNRYDYCIKEKKRCEYKGFFPIYPLELLELLAMMVSSALATACGIGGGTVYSSIILGVQEFEPSRAFPIANCLILCCGFVTYIASVLDKYEHPTNKFVHYDIAIIFGPSMLLGAKFGTIINKIFPTTLLMIGLLFLLCYTINKTYLNILKAKAKEEKILGPLNQMNKNENIKNDFKTEMNKTETLISDYNNNTEIITPIEDINNYTTKTLTEDEKKLLNEDLDPLNWDRIIFIGILEIIVIIDQLIEGNSKLPSFLGIRKCSFLYWLTFLIYIGISIYFINLAITKVKEHIYLRKSIDPKFTSEVIEKVEENTNHVIFMAIIAGIVSSSLGIGGGMITNPVFASLGLDPKESSSTSNFLIVVTAIASTFLFTFAGQLDINFAVSVGIPCTLSALCGSFFILRYINQTGRSSILLVIMEYFLVASLVIAVFKAIQDFSDYGFKNLIQFKGYC